MPTTSTWGLFYPSNSDDVDVPGDMQALAEGVDADLTTINTAKADRIFEPVVDLTITTNLTTLDLNSGNVGFIATAPTANFTLNVTNAPTTNGRAITVTLFVTQGATGRIPNALQIAGVGQTIRWQGGSAPSATNTTNDIDVFSFTLLRRSNAWTVFGSALLDF